jgi:long-subunit fatty acid transport protein
MKKLLLALLMVVVLAVPAFAIEGWVDAIVYPVNDEHNTYAKVKVYIEQEYEGFFGWVCPEIALTSSIPVSDRDTTYVTDLDLGVGYMPGFEAGVGYRITKDLDVRLIYESELGYDGYEGDWTGIGVRWRFGQ